MLDRGEQARSARRHRAEQFQGAPQTWFAEATELAQYALAGYRTRSMRSV